MNGASAGGGGCCEAGCCGTAITAPVDVTWGSQRGESPPFIHEGKLGMKRVRYEQQRVTLLGECKRSCDSI